MAGPRSAVGIARPGSGTTPPPRVVGVDPVEPPPPPVAPGSRHTHDPILIHGHSLSPGQRFYAVNRLSGRIHTFIYRGGGLYHSATGPYVLATNCRTGGAHSIGIDRITRILRERR